MDPYNRYLKSITRKKRTIFIFTAITIISLLSVKDISPALFPSSGEKAVSVKIEYKGAFEKEVEKLLIDLEDGLSGIRDLETMYSVSEPEKGSIYLTFSDSSDEDQGYTEVRDCVNRVYSSFPENVQRPVLTRNGENSFPVFIASFDRKKFPDSRELERIFEGIRGCAEVETGGDGGEEVFISPDMEKLLRSPFNIAHMGRKTAGNNFSGIISDTDGISIKVENRIKSLNDIKSVYLTSGVRITDFASVKMSKKETESSGRINGEKCLVLYIMKAGGSNTVELCRKLKKKSSELGGNIIYNSGRDIEKALSDTAVSVAAGIIAVIFTASVFFRTLSASVLITMNILFSLLISAAAVRVSGFSMDIMTLCGMSVAGGLAIDNSIILIEKFRLSEGNIRKTVENTFLPLLFSFFTTTVVFIPLFFAGEKIRVLFSGMAVAVTAGLAASFFFTFLFIPPFLKKRKPAAEENRNTEKSPGFIIKKSMLFFSGNRLFSVFTVFMLLSAVIYLITSIDYELFTFKKQNNLTLFLEYKEGRRFEYIEKTALQVETRLNNFEGATVTTRLEKERARFDISFPDSREMRKNEKMIRKMGNEYNDIYFHFPDSDEIKNSYDVNIYGKDIEKISDAASDIGNRIVNSDRKCSVIYHFKSPPPSLNIIIDTSKTALSAIIPADIYKNLFTSLTGPVISKYFKDSNETDIRLGSQLKKTVQELNRIPVGSRNKKAVYLGGIAKLEKSFSVNRIYHRNRQRVLSFSVVNGDPKKINSILSSYPFEEGYRGEGGVIYRKKREETEEFMFLVMLSFIFIFITLSVQFESFHLPLLITGQLPLCFAVPLAVMEITGINLSVISALALLLTAGISVNNSILILSPFKWKKRLTVSEVTNIFSEKGRSIIMASLTTALSILPLLLAGGGEGSILAPFSITLISGIIGSILSLPLTLSFACVRTE